MEHKENQGRARIMPLKYLMTHNCYEEADSGRYVIVDIEDNNLQLAHFYNAFKNNHLRESLEQFSKNSYLEISMG